MGLRKLSLLLSMMSSSIVWAAAAAPDLTREYQMPASEVIAERVMKDMECNRFLSKTSFHTEVGGKKVSVVKAVLALDSALFRYAQTQLPRNVDEVCVDLNASQKREILRDTILRVLLQDISGAHEQNAKEERGRRSIVLQSESAAQVVEQGTPEPKTFGFRCAIL
jgi:hypothetical protein